MSESASNLRRWTPEDVLGVKRLSDAQISPDGSRVAYTVHETYKEDLPSNRSSIWVVGTDGNEARQYTSGMRTDVAPRWSPDSRTLAFLSNRNDEHSQGIYLLSVDGGEARRLTSVEGNVVELKWSPDGTWLAYLATAAETEEEKQRREKKDDAIEFEHDTRYSRLWIARVDDTEARQVSTGDVQVWEFSWLPDGQGFVLVCSEVPYEWSWYDSYLATLPLSGGTPRVLYRERGVQLATPSVSPDAAQVAFVRGVWSDRGSAHGEICTVPVRGGEIESLTGSYPASFGSTEWLNDEQLLAIGYEEGEGALCRLVPSVPPNRLWRGDAMFAERWQARFSLTSDRTRITAIREDHSTHADVWTAQVPDQSRDAPDLEWIRCTETHLTLRELWNGDPETVHWTSPDGTRVQGILLKPLDYEPGTPRPLVTVVHGGPSALYSHGFISSYFWVPLLISNGYLVLLPNPRGSTGWGREFAEANLGDMGGGDLQDILAGVDHLVKREIADPEKLGLCGWSYGGYMAAWAVTQTPRFRVAIMGAGIVNWRSFHGVSNIPAWDRLFNQDNPYKKGGKYTEFSPILHASAVQTPTLIVHGEKDECVPVGQGYEWFRALKEHRVETQLVIYPREGHGVQEKVHQEDLMKRSIQWLAKYLDATP